MLLHLSRSKRTIGQCDNQNHLIEKKTGQPLIGDKCHQTREMISHKDKDDTQKADDIQRFAKLGKVSFDVVGLKEEFGDEQKEKAKHGVGQNFREFLRVQDGQNDGGDTINSWKIIKRQALWCF